MNELKIIAHIENSFSEKFGVPRQSGLADTVSRIVFEPEYRYPDAFRGIEGYSHLWLLWLFSEAKPNNSGFSPTVRPPRLGGNKRMGVFATRSPFRPNSIGLSSVEFERISFDEKDSPVLYVRGADLMDKTPIIDVKPYLSYTDSHPDALNGFALDTNEPVLSVVFPDELKKLAGSETSRELTEILAQDPRPQYQDDPERIYSMAYGGFDVDFSVDKAVLTVKNIRKK
ncbi:MAG: tRNA (N6-threonylcarbamoyladenosine(37)-N6)-methyltransferase TrmO [Oscillospiraceae bacterium]